MKLAHQEGVQDLTLTFILSNFTSLIHRFAKLVLPFAKFILTIGIPYRTFAYLTRKFGFCFQPYLDLKIQKASLHLQEKGL